MLDWPRYLTYTVSLFEPCSETLNWIECVVDKNVTARCWFHGEDRKVKVMLNSTSATSSRTFYTKEFTLKTCSEWDCFVSHNVSSPRHAWNKPMHWELSCMLYFALALCWSSNCVCFVYSQNPPTRSSEIAGEWRVVLEMGSSSSISFDSPAVWGGLHDKRKWRMEGRIVYTFITILLAPYALLSVT